MTALSFSWDMDAILCLECCLLVFEYLVGMRGFGGLEGDLVVG